MGDLILFLTPITKLVTAEVTKLLVPTPPVYGTEYNYSDNNGNGVYDPENGTTPADTDTLGSVVIVM